MQIMNAILLDPTTLPKAQAEALRREAMRRNVPLERLIKEAILEKATKIHKAEKTGKEAA